MLLIHQTATATDRLTAGTLTCPDTGCRGQLGPWGRARPRVVRLGPGRSPSRGRRRTRTPPHRTPGRAARDDRARLGAAGRANSEAIRADATVATYRLDAMAHRFDPTGSALGDMVDAVGRATSAWIHRFGPDAAPW